MAMFNMLGFIKFNGTSLNLLHKDIRSCLVSSKTDGKRLYLVSNSPNQVNTFGFPELFPKKTQDGAIDTAHVHVFIFHTLHL